MNKTQVEVIPPGTSIPVNISTELHVRLQQLLLEGLPFKDYPHFMSSVKEVKDNAIKDPVSYHLKTLLVLLSLIEDSAKANNLTIKKEFDLDAPPSS